MSTFTPEPNTLYFFADQPHQVFLPEEYLIRVEQNGRYYVMESAERPGVRGASSSGTCRLAPR